MATENDDMLVERLTPKILASIRSKTKPVESLRIKKDLTGITSIPCYDTTGGQFKNVLVSIDALTLPAQEAVKDTVAATERANAAADRVTDAILDLSNERESVATVITEANRVITETNQSREAIEGNEEERQANEAERISNESYRVTEFGELKKESETYTLMAKDTAEHPTYIGTDNYVYQWNREAQSYNKTQIYVRGEAFSISKVYSSIEEMLSDSSNAFKEGNFCLINTGNVENPDNAKLYVRNKAGSWDFLVDLSGAIGFTGKVPQFFIGTVDAGTNKSSASVSLVGDGVDSDGNPKFLVNYVLPCLSYEDLTPEQIANLQEPANEMIGVLKSTDNAIKESESARVQVEAERVENENIRKADEETRQSNEDARVAAELDRVERFDAMAEEGAKQHYIGSNGNWWSWNAKSKEYIDTGVLAQGGIFLPVLSVTDDMMLTLTSANTDLGNFSYDERTGELIFTRPMP